MVQNEGGAAAAHKTTVLPKRGERGSGKTITVDLTDHPDLLAKIRDAAKGGKSSPPSVTSKWLLWRVLALHAEGKLFPVE